MPLFLGRAPVGSGMLLMVTPPPSHHFRHPDLGPLSVLQELEEDVELSGPSGLGQAFKFQSLPQASCLNVARNRVDATGLWSASMVPRWYRSYSREIIGILPLLKILFKTRCRVVAGGTYTIACLVSDALPRPDGEVNYRSRSTRVCTCVEI